MQAALRGTRAKHSDMVPYHGGSQLFFLFLLRPNLVVVSGTAGSKLAVTVAVQATIDCPGRRVHTSHVACGGQVGSKRYSAHNTLLCWNATLWPRFNFYRVLWQEGS